MSAWLLNKTEIDVLTHWIAGAGVSNSSKDAIGGILWSENYRSIRARYGPYDREGNFLKRPAYHFNEPKVIETYRGEFNPFDKDQIAKLCHFYEYQSCETGDSYYKSRAHRMIAKLEKYLDEIGADCNKEGLLWGL